MENKHKNWLENLNDDEINKFIKNNFNVLNKDYSFKRVEIQNKQYIKINFEIKYGFPAELIESEYFEDEIYLGEFFIKSDDEKINNNAYEFYKLQVDNRKLVFAWQSLLTKSNANLKIGAKNYTTHLKQELKTTIINYYEYMCSKIAIKYLHSDRSFYSKYHEKFLDEVDSFTELENLKNNLRRDKKLLTNYIKNLENNSKIKKEENYDK